MSPPATAPAAPPTKTALRTRWLWAITLLLIPAELAFAFFFTEPYPALFQPAFSGSPQVGHSVLVRIPVVTVTFDDGSTSVVDFNELIPSDEVLGTSLLEAGYGTEERANARENTAFLEKRFAILFPDQVVDTVFIDWRVISYDIATGEEGKSTSMKSVTIDLAGAR